LAKIGDPTNNGALYFWDVYGTVPNWFSTAHAIKTYMNPSDASSPASGVFTDEPYGTYGITSYVANFQSLGHFFNDGSVTGFSDYRIMSIRDITDGLSNTIFMVEKNAVCQNTTYENTVAVVENNGDSNTDPNYYNIWAYGRTAWPEWNPVFAYQVTGPASKFQLNPLFTGPNANCDPRFASAPRSAGILVGLGDGSVHLLSSGIDPNTWWALCTPDQGEVIDGSSY